MHSEELLTGSYEFLRGPSIHERPVQTGQNALFRSILTPDPGITLRRRCGKPSCHCARGQPHCSPALSFSTKGKTSILTLSADLLQEVRVALQRYRHQQQSLERQAEAGLRQLARRLQQARQTARR